MPVIGLPPAMPLMLQETVVSVAPVTVAAKVCVLPKRTEAVAGVIVTAEGGGGSGGGGTTAEAALAPPVLPAQPSVKAATEKRMRSGSAEKHGLTASLDSVRAFSERGRMVRRNAGEGPGKGARAGGPHFLRRDRW